MPDATTVRVKTVLLLFTALLFVVNASISASNAAKISRVKPGTVVHGFSLTGSILGVACSAAGMWLLFIEGGFTIRTFRLIWLFVALLTLFFTCLGIGAWAELSQHLGSAFSSSWSAELAMLIVAAFFWIGTIIIMLEVEQLNLPGSGYTSIP